MLASWDQDAMLYILYENHFKNWKLLVLQLSILTKLLMGIMLRLDEEKYIYYIKYKSTPFNKNLLPNFDLLLFPRLLLFI